MRALPRAALAVLAAGICLAIVLVMGIGAISCASVTLSFSYAGIEEGLAPDGTWLDLSEFGSEENVRAALGTLGLEQVLDAQTVAKSLAVLPASQEAEEQPYFSASYILCLRLPLSCARIVPARRLLAALCDAYRDGMAARHAVTGQALTGALDRAKGMQGQRAQRYAELVCARAVRFLEMRNREAGTFMDAEGTAFSALLARARQLEEAAGGISLQALEELLEQLERLDGAYVRQTLLNRIVFSEGSGGEGHGCF